MQASFSKVGADPGEFERRCEEGPRQAAAIERVVIAIAIATIGAKFGAGGLGTLLFDGIAQNRYDKIWAGALIVAGLALLVNYLLLALENYFTIEKRIGRMAQRQPRPTGHTSPHMA